MAYVSLIWTSRSSAMSGGLYQQQSMAPFLTIPEERPGWSDTPDEAAGVTIPARGFLAAILDEERADGGLASAREAIARAWQSIDESAVGGDPVGTLRALLRDADQSLDRQAGDRALNCLVLLLHGDELVWCNAGSNRLFLCRAGGVFEALTSPHRSAPLRGSGNTELQSGRQQLRPGDVLIAANAELARRTDIEGQPGDIANISEDNADGWLESLVDPTAAEPPVTFSMIGVRDLVAAPGPAPFVATSISAAGIGSGDGATSVPDADEDDEPAGQGGARGAAVGTGMALAASSPPASPPASSPPASPPASSPPAGGGRLSTAGMVATVLLVLAIGLAGFFLLRGVLGGGTATVAPTPSDTGAGEVSGEQTTPAGDETPTVVLEEPAVVTPPAVETPLAATAEPTVAPIATVEEMTTPAAAPVSPAATPIPTSPAPVVASFTYPRLLDDTGYNNSVEFLTVLFGPPPPGDPAYVTYIAGYTEANPDVVCSNGDPVWYCLGGRPIPNMRPETAWVALTGEITGADDDRLLLQSGNETYLISPTTGIGSPDTLVEGSRLSVIGRIGQLSWDPADDSGLLLERVEDAVPLAAAFVRQYPLDDVPSDWRRVTPGDLARPVWLYSSDADLINEIAELPAEAAEALAQPNILLQGQWAQTAALPPQIMVSAVYTLGTPRQGYVCRFGELPDATCP